jgi:serine/threonine protein phosphatase PrpC
MYQNEIMSAFQEDSKIYNECSVRSLDKGQDVACCYRVEKFVPEESYECFIGFDGHGNNTFNDMLKLINLREVADAKDSLSEVLKQITEMNTRTYNSGATYYEAKLYSNRVETCTVGDSQVAVFIDKKLVYISTPHNMKNPAEVERLKSRIESGGLCAKLEDRQVPAIFSKDTLKFRDAEYVYFENGEKIAVSQSLGHNNITGIVPEKHTVFFELGQEVAVVGGSDGLWDMINLCGPDVEDDLLALATMSACEIADIAENRWKQDWNIHWTSSKGELQVFVDSFTNKERSPKNPESGYDDVSVCKIHKK